MLQSLRRIFALSASSASGVFTPRRSGSGREPSGAAADQPQRRCRASARFEGQCMHAVEVRKSPIHDRGVFAVSEIPAGDLTASTTSSARSPQPARSTPSGASPSSTARMPTTASSWSAIQIATSTTAAIPTPTSASAGPQSRSLRSAAFRPAPRSLTTISSTHMADPRGGAAAAHSGVAARCLAASSTCRRPSRSSISPCLQSGSCLAISRELGSSPRRRAAQRASAR